MMSLFWMVILFMVFEPSYQKRYLCDPNLECGCSMKPASLARIVGGEEAGEGTWGWTVSLSMRIGGDRERCGGSVLSSSWIITAAHCVDGISPSDVMIYAGSNILWSGSQNRTVTKIIVHSGYIPDDYLNDIALIQLTSPLDMDDPAVSSICLSSVNSSKLAAAEWPTPNTTVIAVGWGKIFEDGSTTTNLRQVTLNTIDYRASTCSKVIVDAHIQFCAGVPDGTKDTCGGDSGGPLMMFTSTKQWVLVGLTSFGRGCARKAYSGVYTRLAAFEDWIRVNTNGSYSKSKDFSGLTDRMLTSYANTMSRWNYHIFLCTLLLFFFQIVL